MGARLDKERCYVEWRQLEEEKVLRQALSMDFRLEQFQKF